MAVIHLALASSSRPPVCVKRDPDLCMDYCEQNDCVGSRSEKAIRHPLEIMRGYTLQSITDRRMSRRRIVAFIVVYRAPQHVSECCSVAFSTVSHAIGVRGRVRGHVCVYVAPLMVLCLNPRGMVPVR